MIKISKYKGFSLVEILVVMLILMVIIIGVLNVFMEMTRIRQRTNEMLELQSNARFALTTISSKIQMAGYQGPVDSVIIPDPRCDTGTPLPNCGTGPDASRVQASDGVIVFTSFEDRRFMKPFLLNGSDLTCGDSGVFIPAALSPVTGTMMNVCTPSGLTDNQLGPNGQPIMVCGPVANQTTAGCDWILPSRMPPLFNTECSVMSPPAYLCCAIRQVANGPICSPECTLGRNVLTGICQGPAGTVNCHEVIQTLGTGWPTFIDPVPARCMFLPPLQVIQYQVRMRNGRSYLMVRINNGMGQAAGDEWQPVASDIIDMQMCYVLDSGCDSTQTCRRWNWADPPNFLCEDSLQIASVRNIRRAVIQITARTANPVQQTTGWHENPVCVPGSVIDDPPPTDGPAKFRQYTVCTDVLARNLTFKEITPPTVW